MRVRRLGAVALALCLAVPLSAQAATTSVDLTIAKTQRYIYAYGNVSPARPGRVVRVRLLHDDVVVATRRQAQSDQGRYEVRFPRPTSGTCEVKVIFRTPGGTYRATHLFGCGIPDFSTGTASITGANVSQTYDIEIADEGYEQSYGLMYRRWLAPDRGMAFLFESDIDASFYMKNTLIPLTIAFFDSTGRIVGVMDMEPCEQDPCPLYGPDSSYRGALEVNQGTFEGAEGDFVSITRD